MEHGSFTKYRVIIEVVQVFAVAIAFGIECKDVKFLNTKNSIVEVSHLM